MIISDLSYLEVVSEADSIEGGLFNTQDNSSHLSQGAGNSDNTAIGGLVGANALNSSPVAVVPQVNVGDVFVNVL